MNRKLSGVFFVLIGLVALAFSPASPAGSSPILAPDAPPPMVSFSPASQSSDESPNALVITAQLSEVSTQEITVPFTVSGTASGNGLDYTINPLDTVIIPAGDLSAIITVTPVDDSLDEVNESIVLTMGNPVHASQGDNIVSAITILDNDPTPTITFTTPSDSIGENGGSTSITMQLSAPSGLNVTVPFLTSGTATGGGIDYNLTPLTNLSIPAGNLNASLTLTPIDDQLDETDETVLVDMGDPTNALPGAITSHTTTILDDDPTPTLTVNNAFVNEGDSGFATAVFTAALSAASGLEVDVDYATANGTATQPSDYLPQSNTLIYMPGETTKYIQISVNSDGIDENDETFYLNLSNPQNVVLSSPQASGVIHDDDTAGITALPTSGSSGLLTTEVGFSDTFTVTLGSQPLARVTIPISSSDSTEGTLSSQAVTFTPSDWNLVQTVTVNGVDDHLVDGPIDYTIIISPALSADPLYAGFDVPDLPATNVDNDVPGITISPTSGLVTTEGQGAAVFKVVLNTQPASEVTLPLSSSDPGEATLSSTSLVFTPLTWSTPVTVTVTGVDDLLLDGDIDYTIVTGPAISADSTYNKMATADVFLTNREAPSIEWNSPVYTNGVYEIYDPSEMILLEVIPVSQEPIQFVHFYRWDHFKGDFIDIYSDFTPPYWALLDPTNLYIGWNQVYATAYSSQGISSINQRVLLFQRLLLFLPAVFR